MSYKKSKSTRFSSYPDSSTHIIFFSIFLFFISIYLKFLKHLFQLLWLGFLETGIEPHIIKTHVAIWWEITERKSGGVSLMQKHCKIKGMQSSVSSSVVYTHLDQIWRTCLCLTDSWGERKKWDQYNFDSSIKAISDTLTFEALWRNPSSKSLKCLIRIPQQHQIIRINIY